MEETSQKSSKIIVIIVLAVLLSLLAIIYLQQKLASNSTIMVTNNTELFVDEIAIAQVLQQLGVEQHSLDLTFNGTPIPPPTELKLGYSLTGDEPQLDFGCGWVDKGQMDIYIDINKHISDLEGQNRINNITIRCLGRYMGISDDNVQIFLNNNTLQVISLK